MGIEMFKQVALGRDVPEDGLKTGDVATLVDIVPGPAGKPDGAVPEVFNALGDTICATTVSVEDVEPLHEDEGRSPPGAGGLTRLSLKDYLKVTIGKLAKYCAVVRAATGSPGPERDAFESLTGRNYFAPPGFDGSPYVCLRLPTGGGKTLLAASFCHFRQC